VRLVLASLLAVVALALSPASASAQTDDGATLDAVVNIIRDALKEAQTNNVTGFPPLKTVSIGLNTTVTKEGGAKIKFLIFTIGKTKETENASTLSLEMQPPATSNAGTPSSIDPEKLRITLAKAINLAKVAILNANGGTPKLITSKVEVEIKFAVKNETSGGVEVTDIIPIGFEGTGKLEKTKVHSLKLTFQ
jgi:hypothetical protein